MSFEIDESHDKWQLTPIDTAKFISINTQYVYILKLEQIVKIRMRTVGIRANQTSSQKCSRVIKHYKNLFTAQ